MSGRSSKQKGYRAEIEVRDHFRGLGFEANRMPLSGAMNGYKGDVKISRGGKSWLVEVKSRKDSFKSIYALRELIAPAHGLIIAGHEVLLVRDALDLFRTSVTLQEYPKPSVSMRRLTKFHVWLKEADFLVIKDDRKPFLFLKYTKCVSSYCDGEAA